MTSFNATSIGWMRTGIPALFFGGLMLWQGLPFFKGNYKKLLLASVLNALRIYFFFVAFIFTSIGNAIIIYYIWPIFATLFGARYLRERVKARQWILLGIAFLGLIISYSNKQFSFENEDFFGMCAALMGAIVYAISLILFKSETENYKRSELLFYQNFVGFIVFLPFFINQWPQMETAHIGMGLFYGLFIGTFAFYLFFFGLKFLKASVASSIMYLEVVSALFFGFFLLNEELSLLTLIGGSMIVVSSFLIGKE